MYGIKSGILPATGTAAFTVMGFQMGVTQVMLGALATIATGIAAYRATTRKQRYNAAGTH